MTLDNLNYIELLFDSDSRIKMNPVQSSIGRKLFFYDYAIKQL